MIFHQNHLREFEKSKPGEWQANRSLLTWLQRAKYKPSAPISNEYLGRSLTRADIHSISSLYPNSSTLDMCAYIFAWGGMKPHHSEWILNPSNREWVTVAHDLRNGKIDKFRAYEIFHVLSIKGAMPGAGPAYFTKLIFFLPQHDQQRGLIMDQWTGRSINLLTGKAIVKLTHALYVDKNNSVENYINFVTAVSALSLQVYSNKKTENLFLTEQRLFSQGGKSSILPWRKYVKAHAIETPKQ